MHQEKESQEPRLPTGKELREIIEKHIGRLSYQPEIIAIARIGSTASKTETRYSDKDYFIVYEDEAAYFDAMSRLDENYHRISSFVGWYNYNPLHHYAVFDASDGPIPVDVYSLSSDLYKLLINKDAVCFDISELRQSVVTDVADLTQAGLMTAVTCLDQIIIEINVGNNEKALQLITYFIETFLIVLLSENMKQKISHIKKVNLHSLPVPIKEHVVNSFSSPETERLQASERALRNITQLLNQSEQQNYQPENQPLPDFNNDSKDLELKKKLRTIIGIVIIESNHLSEIIFDVARSSLVLLASNDNAINELTKMLINQDRSNQKVKKIRQLSPTHLEIELESNGQIEKYSIYVIQKSLFHIISSESISFIKKLEEPVASADNTTAEEVIYVEIVPKHELSTQLLKAMIRTYRLLSKIIKNEYITACYIINEIRSGQIQPLIESSDISNHLNTKISVLLRSTYPRPDSFEILQAVKALSRIILIIFTLHKEDQQVSKLKRYLLNTNSIIQNFDDETRS